MEFRNTSITGKEARSMRYFHQGWFRQRFEQEFEFLKRQFLQDDVLPFGSQTDPTDSNRVKESADRRNTIA